MPDEWVRAPFARVFTTLPDDQPELWADDELLAWYVRLLLPADRAYPVALPLPRRIPDPIVARLRLLGAIDLHEPDRYQVHGMQKLVESNDRRHKAGGVARSQLPRAPRGRFAPATAQALVDDAGDDAGEPNGERVGVGLDELVPAQVADAGADAGEPDSDQRRWSSITSDETLRDETVEPPYSGSTVVDSDSPARAPVTTSSASIDPLTPAQRAASVREHGPDDAPCDEPELHALHHRFYVGVGWRCLLCENNDPRSFDDRFIAAGGAVPRRSARRDQLDERPF